MGVGVVVSLCASVGGWVSVMTSAGRRRRHQRRLSSELTYLFDRQPLPFGGRVVGGPDRLRPLCVGRRPRHRPLSPPLCRLLTGRRWPRSRLLRRLPAGRGGGGGGSLSGRLGRVVRVGEQLLTPPQLQGARSAPVQPARLTLLTQVLLGNGGAIQTDAVHVLPYEAAVAADHVSVVVLKVTAGRRRRESECDKATGSWRTGAELYAAQQTQSALPGGSYCAAQPQQSPRPTENHCRHWRHKENGR